VSPRSIRVATPAVSYPKSLEKIFRQDDGGRVAHVREINSSHLSAPFGLTVRYQTRASGSNFCAAYRRELRRGADVFFIIGDPNADKFRARLALKMVNAY
jgi:hypothetical protein